MITPADVTKLKCVAFKIAYTQAAQDNFQTDCPETDDLSIVLKLIQLVDQSPIICRTLECSILSIIEKYTITSCTTRDVTNINIR
mgnify:CR=1 FL=1